MTGWVRLAPPGSPCLFTYRAFRLRTHRLGASTVRGISHNRCIVVNVMPDMLSREPPPTGVCGRRATAQYCVADYFIIDDSIILPNWLTRRTH